MDERATSKRLKGLLVEDDDDDARAMQKLLDFAPHLAIDLTHVRTAGDAVVELGRGEPFDIVLLDLVLPDVSGLEALAALRAASRGAPIVVTSAIDDDDVARRAIAAGAQDFIVKWPIDARTLGRRIAFARARRVAAPESKLLARVSHDMRTPLNTVLGMVELLAETELTPRQRSYVAALGRAGEHLLALANDVLGAAQIDVDPTPPPPVSETTKPRARPRRPLHVLVVDDSHESRELVAEYLRPSGAVVDFAQDGASAIAKLASTRYEVVLMDLHLPGMDGYATTTALRKMERERRLRAVPVIALSADALVGTVKRALSVGFTAHLAKPIGKAALLEALRTYVGARLAGEEAPVRTSPEALALLPTFLDNRTKDVARIRAAVGQRDFDTVRNLGHKMRGNGASYGMPNVTKIGARLELAARARDADRVRAEVAELEACVALARGTLGTREAQTPEGPTRRRSGVQARAAAHDAPRPLRKPRGRS